MASIVNEVKIDSGLANRYLIACNSREGLVAGHEETANGHGFGHRFGESRVLMELNSLDLNEEADGVVLEREEASISGSPMDAHGSEVIIGPESRVWEYDNLSDAAGSSDGVRGLHGVVGNWTNKFEVGDMVWGKVKSHPWWPGQIFSEAFASSSVQRAKRDRHLLVAFFGDSSYGWFDPAELIPFDPHYEEKSKQTTFRPFVNAVEEATDERSRRVALALTCYCRNKFNFRPARVLSYFHVDVPGFEPGGIYSSKQIEEARNKFVPDQVLSYVKQMAVCPLADGLPAINLVKKMEMLVAYRRAVFEEFDETYAQAFGVEPVGPSSLTRVVSDHPARFSPRAAPLSGRLVMPEPRRHTKSSSHALSHKLSSAKKDKYVLKRRNPQLPFYGATVTGPSKFTPLDFPFPTQPFGSFHNIFPTAPQPPLPLPTTQVPDASSTGDYLLQKRPSADFADDRPPRQVSPAPLAEIRVSEQKPSPSAVHVPVATAPRTDPPVPGAVSDGATLARPLDAWKPGGVEVAGGIPTKKNIKKRPREDGGIPIPNASSEIMKKKKIKERSNDGQSASTFVSVGPEQPKILDPFLSVLRLPQVDLSSRNLQLPDLVGDLRELALDPYYGSDRNVPAAVLHAFLKFRSLVCKKSFVLPSPAEAEAVKVQATKPPRLPLEAIAASSEIAPAKPAKVGREPPVATKPPKPGFRSNDPSIAGRKRTTSDRLEEMNVKKQKKMDMAKAVISQKGPIGQKETGASSSTAVAASLSSTSAPAASAKSGNAKEAEPVKSRELRVSSPTALMMKFPPRTTLPSIASLKARFARFGPLELSSFRVHWQSYTCKVVYKFKPDAEAALKYARENQMFGQLKVYFHLRDADTQAPEPSADAGWQTQESRPAEGAQFGPGNSARPLINPNQKPSGQLKSILKKHGEDAALSSGREAARVKFMLDNVNGKLEQPPSPPTELVIAATMDTASFPPLPLAPLQKLATNRVVRPPPSSHGSRSGEARSLNDRQYGRAEGRTIVNEDLAKQMVSLMVRCSQIVNSVQTLPGYSPYRPL